MWIAETIDLDNHDSVVKFMKNQSDKIEKLEEENEQLKYELLCKQLDKAPTEPINCKCHYEVKE